jgi:HEAT repeat protein
MSASVNITLKQLLDAMLDVDKPFHPRYLYRLSDLSPEEMAELEKEWVKIPSWRRQAIMEDVEELGDSDSLLSFEALSRYALHDSDPKVRELALRTLWEYEVVDLIPEYLEIVITDPDPGVRAAAASALGQYIYLGEIEELREQTWHAIEDRLLDVTHGNDSPEVRRRALESLGFSSREEVPVLIEQAYRSGDEDWLVSSLYAMGRSASQTWAPLVTSMLESESDEVRYEAVRALGELEVKSAVPRLKQLLLDEDDDVRLAAIWSLSQIGGEGVRELIETLYEEAEDDEEAEFIETALDNLAFTEDMNLFDLLDISEDEDLVSDDLPDLEEDEGDLDD